MNALLIFALVVIVGFLVVTSEALNTYQPVEATPVREVVVMPTPNLVPTVAPKLPPAVQGGDLLSNLRAWLGVRYQWGGCTRNGVDCSCMVQNVLRTVGINAPRTTKPQFAWGTPVSRSELQLGDLVFWNNTCKGCGPNPTHVGMAIGGDMVIHCGDPCQVASISAVGEYAGARRPS